VAWGRAEGVAEGVAGRVEGLALGRSLGIVEGWAEGIAAATSAALLAVLNSGGIDVPEDFCEDVLDCADLDQLGTWFHRALTATSLEEVVAA
jgi:hypothetical protein